MSTLSGEEGVTEGGSDTLGTKEECGRSLVLTLVPLHHFRLFFFSFCLFSFSIVSLSLQSLSLLIKDPLLVEGKLGNDWKKLFVTGKVDFPRTRLARCNEYGTSPITPTDSLTYNPQEPKVSEPVETKRRPKRDELVMVRLVRDVQS